MLIREWRAPVGDEDEEDRRTGESPSLEGGSPSVGKNIFIEVGAMDEPGGRVALID